MYADVEGNIFYVRTGPGSQNPRGRRALDLLATADRMTLEDATRITLDTYAGDSEHWRAALTAAAKAFAGGARVGVLKEALDLLANWAGHRSVDSPAATLYWVWRAKLKDDNAQPAEIAILQGTALPRDQQETLLRALAAARDEIVKRSGHREVPWGEVHRIRRGDQSWPAAPARRRASSTASQASPGARSCCSARAPSSRTARRPTVRAITPTRRTTPIRRRGCSASVASSRRGSGGRNWRGMCGRSPGCLEAL